VPVNPNNHPDRRQPGRPSAVEQPEVRDALLEAAGRLFAMHGASEVSIRRVATEAGVTPAMVHYYFGGKEGLYDALLERTLARIVERVRAVANRRGDQTDGPAGRIGALLEVFMAAFAAEPWVPTIVVREVLSEGGRLRERFIEDYASHIAILLPGLLRSEIDGGGLRDDLDPELAFLSLMGMVVMPFVARPVVERVLGIDYGDEFVRRFVAHTQRLFVDGAGS